MDKIYKIKRIPGVCDHEHLVKILRVPIGNLGTQQISIVKCLGPECYCHADMWLVYTDELKEYKSYKQVLKECL